MRFKIDTATGYNTTITMVFTAAAGKTTDANSAANGPGNSAINKAEPKKTVPEIMVPITVKTAIEMIDLLYLLTARNKAKNTNDVHKLINNIWKLAGRKRSR